MKARRILCLALALFSPTALAEVKLPPKKDFHLFLLAGQSNMAGRGKIDDEARKPTPQVFSLNKQQEWQPAIDPLHWDKPAAGVGIGKTFGEILVAKDSKISVGLIPTACGGSPIETWQPGKAWSQTKSHPWDDSIAAAKRAMKDGTLKAILWHQGESDASAEKSAVYQERLEDLIKRFRTELDAPDLPFIIGQLGRFPAKPWSADREAIDAAHQEVAKKLKNVRFVPINEPKSIGDDLHFDSKTIRAFAKGYADAYLEMEK
jgi:hypothetical protein